ncbi:peptide/nickel transport system ATP-binding protein [Desulfitobacterium sp. LBE]|nr:peptide/nickel transport system ATP-binding protein [Desulfitobacterium sp. LBE]
MSTEILLSVRNLRTCFETDQGEVAAVDGVDFEVNKGEVVAVVGESGCGKSVTAFSILGLVSKPGKIKEGHILFHDKDLTRISEREMQKLRGNDISMIFQEPLTSLNPVYKIGFQISEVILLHQNVSKKEAREQAIKMLKRVNIPRADKVIDSYPFELSGGMRQRIMIAMALSCNPQLLIADEPTTALDVTIQAQILELMKDLQKKLNTAILLITHDLGVVAEMADRVIVMYAGKVVEVGDIYTLFNHPKHPYTRGLLNSIPKIHELKDQLVSIRGTVPIPSNMPKGCRFHPRCPLAMAKCIEQPPELLEIKPKYHVSCWLHEVEEVNLDDEFRKRKAASGGQ